MKYLTILVDDERTLKPDLIARTFEAAIVLETSLNFEHVVLLMDHDLGDPDPTKTGYDFLCHIEKTGNWPARVQLVTSNPVGVKRMDLLLTSNGFIRMGTQYLNRRG